MIHTILHIINYIQKHRQTWNKSKQEIHLICPLNTHEATKCNATVNQKFNPKSWSCEIYEHNFSDEIFYQLSKNLPKIYTGNILNISSTWISIIILLYVGPSGDMQPLYSRNNHFYLSIKEMLISFRSLRFLVIAQLKPVHIINDGDFNSNDITHQGNISSFIQISNINK